MKITEKSAKTEPATKPDQMFADDALPNFKLRIQGDKRTYVVEYSFQGTMRRKTSALVGKTSCEAARLEAIGIMDQVRRLKIDPMAVAAKTRAAAETERAETFSAILPRFLKLRQPKMKLRSFEALERHLTKHAEPLHGLPVKDIDTRAAAKFLARFDDTPTASNHVRSSLSTFWEWMIGQGFIDRNPWAGKSLKHETKARERALTIDELVRV